METIFVNPPADFTPPLMAEQLVRHREAVRQVAANLKGYLVGVRDRGRPGPLAELLDPDDPVERGYGHCFPAPAFRPEV